MCGGMFCMKAKDRSILLLGLDAAGKTTLLYKLKLDQVIPTIPTIGFNVEKIRFRDLRFIIYDIRGVGESVTSRWKPYYQHAKAVVFVVDSSDKNRFDEVALVLSEMMSDEKLHDAKLLVFANKQDLPNAVPYEELVTQLNLQEMCSGRDWKALPCSAYSGNSLKEGLLWLSQTLE